ncbi:DUF6602 domain-containing protein [Verrucosispora sioxanthis]|uniref:DUF6602 domain-containing protein n=1 Tax=Verrucosispora sioxanthis TaxID=2499994 RepID=A0A6M1KU60_9ACTN|nr:DUF6602 domain-containing protein [Verrucosispora sioxanthis]NEE64428.1 hypothetical protein [Verrucosispora sioxanthis]NGM13538.1 hypothetical protein [Verrucosispora sioxanthis]
MAATTGQLSPQLFSQLKTAFAEMRRCGDGSALLRRHCCHVQVTSQARTAETQALASLAMSQPTSILPSMPRSRNRRRDKPRTSGPPDIDTWQPKLHPSESLNQAFYSRCHQIEREILSRVAYEKRFNENHFDSGWAVEDIIREALRELLPKRYAVRAASLSDTKGFSAGDCDVVIFNEEWFPAIKVGPSKDSRKVYLPIEGAYAVLEVKQTLTRRSLEEAMRKLVVCHRLFRPPVAFNRVVENDTSNSCTHWVSNPLFSAVVAGDLAEGFDTDAAVEHFIRVNQLLPRKDVVRALCILGHGTLSWGYRASEAGTSNSPEGLAPATFMTSDLYSELVPVYGRTEPDDSPFYELVQGLMNHLFHSVLGPDNISVHYGHSSKVRTPSTDGATLPPDPNLLSLLDDLCIDKDVSTESAYHRAPRLGEAD